MDPTQAAAEAARRKVRRASGLLRDAARDLAAAVDGQTVLGVLHAHDATTIADAEGLIALGVGRYGAVDVIVIARPTGRQSHTHHGPQRGAKENEHGQQTA